MVVSQWKVRLRVVAKQQTNTCPRVIRAQRTDSGLMAMLQQTTMLRVVGNGWIYLTPQATSAQRTDSSLMAVLQQTAMLRVFIRPQTVTSPVVKSARLYRRNTPRLRGNASHILEKKEVKMIFGGSREVRSGQRMRDKYTRKAKKPP